MEAGTAQAVANHYVTATRKDVQEPETGSDVGSVSSSLAVELAKAREDLALREAAVAKARLERLEAEAASSSRSRRSRASEGSGAHAPTLAAPPVAPLGPLDIVPKVSILKLDPSSKSINYNL